MAGAYLDAVAAVMAVANILRSSLGPHGLDKMLVDDIGKAVSKRDVKRIGCCGWLRVRHWFCACFFFGSEGSS